MTVWFDFGHIPQYNFCKQMILSCLQKGYYVYITVLNRGRMPSIVKSELETFNDVKIDVVGEHKMKKFSAVWESSIKRIWLLNNWLSDKHIDAAISSTLPCAFAARAHKIPMFAFSDDAQRPTYRPIVICSTQMTNCYIPKRGKIASNKMIVKPVLKEWAYLSPKYFKSNIDVLQKYGVKPKEYVFLREVSVGTMNYATQKSGAILGIKDLIPKNKKVLLSLEEKHRRNEYPKDWILLQEPIDDIHSVIYYSAGLVSSGDSMAREAALLGVPSYYLGVRHSMPANAAAHKVAGLQNELSMPFEQWIKTLDVDANEAAIKQEKLRKHIDEEFIDINEYMLSLVDEVAKNKQKK